MSNNLMYTTYIKTTAEKLWIAITNPEFTRQYWEHENISDWVPGAGWQHVRDTDARPVEIVGKVIEVAAPHRLVISWAGVSQAENPAAYSRVIFEIAADGDRVRLTVSHLELEAGSGMANGISKGWPLVLSSLKSYLETGQGFDLSGRSKA